jgi:arylsulfatase A-like enzyme
MMKIPIVLLLGFLLALVQPRLHAEQQADRPHVVLILADDLGYGDLSCYNPQSQIRTAHLDRLAAEGMQFTDAHAGGSVCIPSRYALMTGRFAVRKPMNLASGPLIEEGRTTIASLLRDRGYATAMVGKWHLGFDPFLQNASEPADYSQLLRGGPIDCGFDFFFGMHASLDIPPYFYIRGRHAVTPPSDSIDHNDEDGGEAGWNQIQGAFWRKGGIAPGLKLEEVTPRFFEEAEGVIRQHAAQEEAKPLFLYLALPSPHTPWLPLEEFRGKSGAGSYGDFVLQIDAGVGRILEVLGEAGMAKETLVIFSSDNGPVWYDKDREKFGHDSVGGLRGMKATSWEGGHRMPFLARWPGRVAAGAVSDQLVVFSDLLATFAELRGDVQVPEGMAEDSVSFLASLLDAEGEARARPPVVHDRETVRDGDWKLILPRMRGPEGGKQGKPQLYNLASDPAEQENLAGQHPERVEHLGRWLEDWLQASR